MAGLAVGALYFPRYLKYLKYSLNKLYKISFGLLALALVALPYQFIYGLSAIKIQWLNYSLIFFQTLLISSISGFLFYLSEQLNLISKTIKLPEKYTVPICLGSSN